MVYPGERLHCAEILIIVLTARNAGVRACEVRWGIQPETFAEAQPDFLISDMRELVELIL